jgi:RNA polymerase sigma factor (sigma-70 family)
MIEITKNVEKAIGILTQKLGHNPTNKEIATYMGGEKAGFTVKKINDIRKINMNVASIDNQTTTDENTDFSKFIENDNIINPDVFAEKNELTEGIDRIMATNLTKLEETIIRMRYGLNPYTENYSFDAVAQTLNKTRESIRQIEAKALKKIKSGFSNNKMELYKTSDEN